MPAELKTGSTGGVAVLQRAVRGARVGGANTRLLAAFQGGEEAEVTLAAPPPTARPPLGASCRVEKEVG